MGTSCSFAGEAEAGIAHAETALRLNPQDPSNFFRFSGMAVAHYVAGDYEASRACAERSLQGNPKWRLAHIMLIASLVCLGAEAAAASAMDEFLRTFPNETASTVGELPFSADDHRSHVVGSLVKAGLPA